MDFPCGSVIKESARNAGDLGSIPGRDGRAWWAAIYRVAQSWTGLKRLSSSSRRMWQPVLASTLQYFCLENPPP